VSTEPDYRAFALDMMRLCEKHGISIGTATSPEREGWVRDRRVAPYVGVFTSFTFSQGETHLGGATDGRRSIDLNRLGPGEGYHAEMEAAGGAEVVMYDECRDEGGVA
jgi:hypothetical protein